MGWIKNATLILAGAAAGYLANQQLKERPAGKDLQHRQEGNTLQKFLPSEGTMAQFFDSKYGQPLQKVALKGMKFVADVKAGMIEKEAEIQQKLEEQKKDLRPGSLDNWLTPSNLSASTSHQLENEMLIEGHADQLSEAERRILRDKSLGEDFFTA